MKSTLISALASALPGNGVPDEIVYLPEGKHTITPQSHPKGITVNVPAERGDAIAATLQKDLEKRQAQNVLPWLDFEHTRKYPVSGQPKSFRYEKGKGVMCTVEWSRSGRLAIKGKDANYFSPEVYIDENGVPNGLPDRGPVGSICTEPAFREIPRIAASNADEHPAKSNAMSHILILATIGLLTEAEAALEGAETLARQRVAAMKAQTTTIETLTKERDGLTTKLAATEKERDGFKEKITASETEATKAKEKRADDLVKAAVADGRIAPKDEETQKGFRERLTAGDEFAEKMLTGLPKLHKGLDKPLITGGAADRKTDDDKNLTGRELVAAALAEEAAQEG